MIIHYIFIVWSWLFGRNVFYCNQYVNKYYFVNSMLHITSMWLNITNIIAHWLCFVCMMSAHIGICKATADMLQKPTVVCALGHVPPKSILRYGINICSFHLKKPQWAASKLHFSPQRIVGARPRRVAFSHQKSVWTKRAVGVAPDLRGAFREKRES